MSFLTKIFGTKEQKLERYQFNDNDRQTSADLRLLRAKRKSVLEQIEIEKANLELQKAKIELEDLKAELMEDEDDEESGSTADAMITTLLTSVLAANKQPTAPIVEQPQQTVLTDDDIKNIVHSIPEKYLKMARKMPEEQLRSIGKMQMPNLSDLDLNRAIAYIKSLN